jgi:L-aspartate oxidase
LPVLPRFRIEATPKAETMVLEHDWDSVRRVMWDYVGIMRDRERLDIALERVRSIRSTVEKYYLTTCLTPDLVELRNIALIGELIVLCAQSRHESRGLHYTLDHPDRLAEPVDTHIRRGEALDGRKCSEPDGNAL